jgi:hypothetical protein
MAFLIPGRVDERRRGQRSESVQRWTFDLPHWYETWLFCSYGPVDLALRIPVNATECVATVAYVGEKRQPTVFICK